MESAKLVLYVISNRKAVKAYLDTCLECLATGEDEVRTKDVIVLRMDEEKGEGGEFFGEVCECVEGEEEEVIGEGM